MHIIQEVDPQFQRTIVVSSKFDNRMKEFGERWEVDRYLSAAGYLHQNVQPFFVALPKVSFHTVFLAAALCTLCNAHSIQKILKVSCSAVFS